MPGLPVTLILNDQRCVVVGGGKVALRRACALLEASAQVTVIAPDITPPLADLPVQIHQRPYQPGDLNGARLVVIATNNPQTNDAVTADARAAGVLINRADAPDQGDLTVPALARLGPVTLAVDTDGTSATAAAAIRDQLTEALAPDWPRLLTLAAPYRAILQDKHPDPDTRVAKLKKLSSPDALARLKDRGEADLLTYYDALVNEPGVD